MTSCVAGAWVLYCLATGAVSFNVNTGMWYSEPRTALCRYSIGDRDVVYSITQTGPGVDCYIPPLDVTLDGEILCYCEATGDL